MYVDSTVLMGNTGEMDASTGQFDKMTYMSCLPANGFFPDLANTPRTGARCCRVGTAYWAIGDGCCASRSSLWRAHSRRVRRACTRAAA